MGLLKEQWSGDRPDTLIIYHIHRIMQIFFGSPDDNVLLNWIIFFIFFRDLGILRGGGDSLLHRGAGRCSVIYS